MASMTNNMGYRIITLFICFLLLSGCLNYSSDGVDENGQLPDNYPEICNGLDFLCARSYDNVTFPETHNSFATHEDGIYYPASNHATGFQAQWDAGMRAFMLDTHYATQSNPSVDEVRFCHGDDDNGYSPCIYGEVSPNDWLGQLNQSMINNPNDVVTLLIENYVQAEHLFTVLNNSIPIDRWYIHQIDSEWPTLAQLIMNNTNLVIFWEQGGDDEHPYFHDFLTHSWTTDYAEDDTDDMNCEVYRGNGTQVVFHMNSWLSGPLGLSDPLRAEQANDADFLVARAEECIEMHGKRPTFIAVDWWGDGDVVEAAKRINLLI